MAKNVHEGFDSKRCLGSASREKLRSSPNSISLTGDSSTWAQSYSMKFYELLKIWKSQSNWFYRIGLSLTIGKKGTGGPVEDWTLKVVLRMKLSPEFDPQWKEEIFTYLNEDRTENSSHDAYDRKDEKIVN